MTTRLGFGLVWVLVGAAGAAAQPGYGFPQGAYGYPQGGYGYPGGGYGATGLNPANIMPNIYNPRTQPLSPYLNLSRGGLPAANYYYGVRPGTIGGAGSLGGAPILAQGGQRAPFLPQYGTGDPTLPAPVPPGGTATLPPAGHPVAFGNTMGYFPGMGGTGGRRPGLGGIGATGTAPPRR